MKSTVKILGLSALALAIASPAMAENAPAKTKTHTVTEVVGYEETIEYRVPAKDEAFAKMDTNRDGVVTFNEFRNNTNHTEPYGVFTRIDTNRDDLVQLDELRVFSKTKGSHTESSSRFNFNKPKTVADIKVIEEKKLR